MRNRALFVLIWSSFVVRAQESDGGLLPDPPIAPLPSPGNPVSKVEAEPKGIQWQALILQSLVFLSVEHGYRYATEPGTRHPDRPFFRGYLDAVGALHGWADGDPFYVNYVGHPMQGAVSGFLWIQNDRAYRAAEFGRNSEYWKSRLRAGAFAFVYSEQMEIGPLSEASIGNVQAPFPQQGFVDHVVTPVIGLGWLVTEDAMDRYVIRLIERRTQNRYLIALVRGGLNPSRSFANVVGGQWPWARTRSMNSSALAATSPPPRQNPRVDEPPPGVPPFELVSNAYVLNASSGPCIGGGASAGFRIQSEWQAVLDVSGCKMTGLKRNLSGDSLSYMAGLRWTPQLGGRWLPYAQLLAGGNKLTQELMLPGVKAILTTTTSVPDHSQYTKQFQADSFAIAAGSGIDFRLNRALALRVVNLEYTRSWAHELNGFPPPRGLQIKAGIAVHMGTW